MQLMKAIIKKKEKKPTISMNDESEVCNVDADPSGVNSENLKHSSCCILL